MTNKFTRNSEYLNNLLEDSINEGRECVAGGLIINNEKKIFVQKRSHDRKLFPGCWDIAGGHVDPGETIYDALEREINEETGWRLNKIINLIYQFDWETSHNNEIIKKREFDFLVTVEGDLRNPVIEENKFSEYRWVGDNDIEILKENRPAGDYAIYEMVKKSLKYMEETYERK